MSLKSTDRFFVFLLLVITCGTYALLFFTEPIGVITDEFELEIFVAVSIPVVAIGLLFHRRERSKWSVVIEFVHSLICATVGTVYFLASDSGIVFSIVFMIWVASSIVVLRSLIGVHAGFRREEI